MNSTNIVLGITSLFLSAGFGYSLGTVSESRRSYGSILELAQLKSDLAKLKAQEMALNPEPVDESAPSPIPGIPAVSESTPVPLSAELKDAIANQLEMIAEDDPDEPESTSVVVDTEAAQEKAAEVIKNAATLGTITVAKKETALVIFTPADETKLEPGTIFSVRRGTGIIGQIKIDRFDESGVYVATMRPQGFSPDGYPDIQADDTVIETPKVED